MLRYKNNKRKFTMAEYFAVAMEITVLNNLLDF